MSSLAAPGLAYAFTRGPVPLHVTLKGDERRVVEFRTVTLDPAFVMKAALTVGGHRMRQDQRITDTADAVMLAAACLEKPGAIAALAANRRQSEVKAALGWIRDRFESPKAAMPRRVAEHFQREDLADWAVDVAARFNESINAT